MGPRSLHRLKAAGVMYLGGHILQPSLIQAGLWNSETSLEYSLKPLRAR